MWPFRDVLVDEIDTLVFEDLHDSIELDGRPIPGIFQAPWIEPRIGHLDTGIIEPHVTIRNRYVQDASLGSMVAFDAEFYEVVAIQPDGTGLTTLVLRPID